MGHTEIDILPNNKLCDFYLPKEYKIFLTIYRKVGLILLNRIMLNYANTEEINCTGEFMKEVLVKEGITASVVSFNKIRGFGNNYKESIKYFNSLSK